jgi:AAA+ superfamily predicted ATPase
MNSKPECVESLPRETIRRFLDGLPLIGFGTLLLRVEAFLKIASVLPTPGRTTQASACRLGILPSVLAHGRSGTGKTTFGYLLYLRLTDLIDEDVVYYHVRLGSLLNPNLGQTSRNIEDLFDFLVAAKDSKEVPFVHFDEIDAVALSRARASEHDAIRRALSSILSSLDRMLLLGSHRWILYATTNIVGLVDPALLRRFHQQLDFERTPWSVREYQDFLVKLAYPDGPPTLVPSPFPTVAKACHRKKLTPNDVRQLVMDAYLTFSLPQGRLKKRGSLPETIKRLAAAKKRTPLVNGRGL